MDLKGFLLQNLGLNKNELGRVFTFVDYGNVDKWFFKDRGIFQGKVLNEKNRIKIDIIKLGEFVDLFSDKKFFYYGVDPKNVRSKYVQTLADKKARFRTISKDIQRIKHYLDGTDSANYSKEQLHLLHEDNRGVYVEIPKCNFDVEITMDIVRFSDKYDTIVLFSSDSDFVRLLGYLRQMGKKIVLFYSGPTSRDLKNQAHIKISAQRIKEIVGFVK